MKWDEESSLAVDLSRDASLSKKQNQTRGKISKLFWKKNFFQISPLKTGLVIHFVEFSYLNNFGIKDTVCEQSKNSRYPTSKMQNKAS